VSGKCRTQGVVGGIVEGSLYVQKDPQCHLLLIKGPLNPHHKLMKSLLELKTGKVLALMDTGAQFSCMQAYVAEFLFLMGEPCTFTQCSVNCVLANGQPCQVTNAMKMRVKLLSFTWRHEFKVLNGGPFPIILGIDFLRQTEMLVDPAGKSFYFKFAPGKVGRFPENLRGFEIQPFLQALFEEIPGMMGERGFMPESADAQS
jgi:hypothetical protein